MRLFHNYNRPSQYLAFEEATLFYLEEILKGLEHMEDQFAELQDEVTQATTVSASAVTLIQGLHDQLAAAGTDPQKLADLRTSLKASVDALAASVSANTPAASAASTPTPPADPAAPTS